MKNTIKKLREARTEWHNLSYTSDRPMIDATVAAIESLARRLSKLERAEKSATGYSYTDWLRSEIERAKTSPSGEVIRVHGLGTPERKQAQEEFPKRETEWPHLSVDVLLTIADKFERDHQVVGYYNYHAREWYMRGQHGLAEDLYFPVKSWQYITDPATTPPTVAPVSTWVSVEERLPEREIGESTVTVKVMDASDKVYKAFYNYNKRYWTRTDTPLFSFNDVVPVKWQPLPEPPNE